MHHKLNSLGCGLGLHISNMLVQYLRGDPITVNSIEGKGSIFTITVHIDSNIASTKTQILPSRNPFHAQYATVLIVDHSYFNLKWLIRFCKVKEWIFLCTPVLFAASESTTEDVLKEWRSADVSEIIPKPCSLHTLRKKTQEYLSRNKMDSCIQTEEYFSEYVPQLPSLNKCYNVVSVIDYSTEARQVYPIRDFKSTLPNPTLRYSDFRKKFHRRLSSAGQALPSVKTSPKRSVLHTSLMNPGRLSVLLALHSPKRSMKSAKFR